MSTGSRRRFAAFGLAVALALTTTGCLQSDDSGDGGDGGNGGEDVGGNPDLGSDDGDGTVEILGAFGGAEEEAFNASLEAFQQESGITVEYVSDQDFTTTVLQRVESGDSPDIGLFPQPGGLLELAEDGNVAPIDGFLDVASLEETLIGDFLQFGELDGTYYGAPMRMAVKSIVWYPKQAYEATGASTSPATFEELQGIADQFAASGTAPWCMGWESDQATGWVGTDWLEEMVLRLHGPDVYDQWVAHEIPFNDERIAEALDAYGQIVFTEGQVYGGTDAILNVSFGDTFSAAFENPPKCLMMRQGNFISGFFPDEVQANLDQEVGTFVLPPTEEGGEQPMLGGGDIAALFNSDDEEAQQVMEFLTSDQFGGEWAAAGGWLSPHATFDASQYPDETTRNIAKLAAESDVFRYDASDLMPKSVGSGTFWTEMVAWAQGQSTEDTLTNIEESWPS